MNRKNATQIVADLAASQRGFFTAAQARDAGVDKLALSRLCAAGVVERVSHGVYRASGAPGFREEALYAVWLGLVPDVPAYSRPRDETDFVVSHATAAWLHGLGELNPEPLTFTHPERRQTRKAGLRFVRARLDPRSVEVVGGIPVTTAAQTVLDLLSAGEDLSLLSSVVKGAVRIDPSIGDTAFAEQVDRYAKAYGYSDGFSLYELLRK